MHNAFRGIRTLRLLAFFGALLVFASCSYRAAMDKLPPEERAEFRAHSKVMTSRQIRTYLAKPTPDARAAYLEEIGSAQRFAALDLEDRESVLAGHIRVGMSSEALRFLWGEPYDIKGYVGRYENWFYNGSAYDLAKAPTVNEDFGTVVQVRLIDGRVKWWLETVPTEFDTDDGGDDSFRN